MKKTKKRRKRRKRGKSTRRKSGFSLSRKRRKRGKSGFSLSLSLSPPLPPLSGFSSHLLSIIHSAARRALGFVVKVRDTEIAPRRPTRVGVPHVDPDRRVVGDLLDGDCSPIRAEVPANARPCRLVDAAHDPTDEGGHGRKQLEDASGL